MSSVPIANATLTLIKGGGLSADYDTPDGSEPTTRFTGSVGCYLVEQQRTEIGNDMDVVDRSKLVVPVEQGLLAQRLDMVTYTWQGTSRTRTVQNIEHAEVAGTSRLYLEDK